MGSRGERAQLFCLGQLAALCIKQTELFLWTLLSQVESSVRSTIHNSVVDQVTGETWKTCSESW